MMIRKVASTIFLLTSVLIGIGSLGHAHQWDLLVRPALGGLRPELLALLKFVWFWVSGAMALFGVLLVWTWWRLTRGDENLYLHPWSIGLFYVVAGVCGVRYVGGFFSLFIVLGVILCGATWALQRYRTSERINA